jgi:heme exporter protein C
MGRFVAVRLAIAAAVVLALYLAFCVAPLEQTMGDPQRIVYVHVPVAWLGLCGMLAMAACGAAYLARRNLLWDSWALAAGEVGWTCCSLTLVTGSLWARSAWGTWWEWDPRLTTAFILWMIYSGILAARSSIHNSHRKARMGAVLAILGSLDIPLVVMATRWFRGLHPVNPDMVPAMRIALIAGVASWTAVFLWLTFVRRRQIAAEQRIREIEAALDAAS